MPDSSASPDSTLPSEDVPSDLLREVARAPPVRSDVLLLGTLLGRYRVDRRIGRGGMGVVYAAHDTLLDRSVALKVLPPDLVGDRDRRRRLLKEARSAARAAHPGIAAIYDVQEVEEQVIIAMELVRGETLQEVLRERAQKAAAEGAARGLPIAQVLSIGAQLAEALASAHQAGVVHRDLKPANLMWTDEGRVRILDFGLAHVLRSDESPASLSGDAPERPGMVGTPGYMAPEQARGAPPDAAADLFSLGVVLYELLCGAKPFDGATPEARLLSLHATAPESLSRRRKGIPARLDALVLRCLERQPERRPASASEIAERLRALASAPGAAERSLGSGETAYARRRWIRALVALGALVAVAAAAVTAIRGRSPASPGALVVASPTAVLACPIFEARGVEDPAGWLGAAAASLVCKRSQALLGGDPRRVRVPASLLGLSPVPTDDFPADPFGDSDARQRSLAAAASAALHVEGAVAREGSVFSVRISWHDAAGTRLAEGAATHEQLHVAVRDAMAPAIAAGIYPANAPVDPEVARVSGARATEVLLARTDFDLAIRTGADTSAELARLARHQSAFGERWVEAQADLIVDRELPWSEIAQPPPSRASAADFAWSAPVHAMGSPGVDVIALAEEAHALSSREASTATRMALHIAEARLLAFAGSYADARALVLPAVQADPTGPGYRLLVALGAEPSQGHAIRAFAAWCPEDNEAWNRHGLARGPGGGGAESLGRAYVLGTHRPLLAAHLGMFLLMRKERERARGLAAELLARSSADDPASGADPRRIAAHLLLARIEASEGRFGAARRRARSILFGRPEFGSGLTAEQHLATLLMDIAILLEDPHEDADLFVATFVDHPRPRLHAGPQVPGRVASVCAFASPPAAQLCFRKLNDLLRTGYFRVPLSPPERQFVEGAEAFSRGEWSAAANAWRPLGKRPGSRGQHLLPIAFDRAGEPDLAAAIDAQSVENGGMFDGLSPAHVRAAERAFARNDTERARTLARQVVAAWRTADVAIPAVARLSDRLRETDRPPGR